MINVPIVIGFDFERVIGHAEIDETQLPPYMDYCFALAYKITSMGEAYEKDKGELLGISVQDDAAYLEYLQRGSK